MVSVSSYRFSCKHIFCNTVCDLGKAGYANSLSCCVGGLCQHRDYMRFGQTFVCPYLLGEAYAIDILSKFVGGENNYRIAQIAGCFSHYLTFLKITSIPSDRSSPRHGPKYLISVLYRSSLHGVAWHIEHLFATLVVLT